MWWKAETWLRSSWSDDSAFFVKDGVKYKVIDDVILVDSEVVGRVADWRARTGKMEPRAGFEPAISSCLAPKWRYQGDALANLSHRGKQHYNALTQILILP